jgi:hypothetical protein
LSIATVLQAFLSAPQDVAGLQVVQARQNEQRHLERPFAVTGHPLLNLAVVPSKVTTKPFSGFVRATMSVALDDIGRFP